MLCIFFRSRYEEFILSGCIRNTNVGRILYHWRGEDFTLETVADETSAISAIFLIVIDILSLLLTFFTIYNI